MVNCAAGAISSTPCNCARFKDDGSAVLGSLAKTPPSQQASGNTQVFGIRQIPELMAYLDYYVTATATLDGHICPQTLTILHHARPQLFSTFSVFLLLEEDSIYLRLLHAEDRKS